jgi:hypothetical protein
LEFEAIFAKNAGRFNHTHEISTKHPQAHAEDGSKTAFEAEA